MDHLASLIDWETILTWTIDGGRVTIMVQHQGNVSLTAYVERRGILEIKVVVSILIVSRVASEIGSSKIHESGIENGDMDGAMDPGTKVVTVDEFFKTLRRVGVRLYTRGFYFSHAGKLTPLVNDQI